MSCMVNCSEQQAFSSDTAAVNIDDDDDDDDDDDGDDDDDDGDDDDDDGDDDDDDGDDDDDDGDDDDDDGDDDDDDGDDDDDDGDDDDDDGDDDDDDVSGLPLWSSIITTGVVATFYTTLGGIRAVVWTDVLQLFVLTFGLLLIVIMGVVKVGGPKVLWDIAWEGKRLQSFSFSFDPLRRHSVWALAFGGAGMMLGIFGANQTQIQRYLACKDMRTARRAILLNVPMNSLFMVIQLASGLVAYVYFVDCDPIGASLIKKADQLLPYLVMVLFDGIPVIRGLFLSIIFAASLSTLSSGVNSLATVILEDIVRPLFYYITGRDVKPKSRTLLATISSAIVGLSTVGLAFLFDIMSSNILPFAYGLFGAVGGPILAIFSLGILVPCVNQYGGIAALLSSLTVGIWLCLGAIVYPPPVPSLPLSTINCSTNVTNITQVVTGTRTFYSISYLYYTPVCLVVALVVGLVFSAATGFNTKSPVPSQLLAWQCRMFYRRIAIPVAPQWRDRKVVTKTQLSPAEFLVYAGPYQLVRHLAYPEMAQLLEHEFTHRKVRGSNPTPVSRLPMSGLRQTGSIPALVLPLGGMEARHRKVATAERYPDTSARRNTFLISLTTICGSGLGARGLKWFERELTDRKVHGSNPTSASRLPLSRFGQPGSALVLPSGGMTARHRKGVLQLNDFFGSGFQSRLLILGVPGSMGAQAVITNKHHLPPRDALVLIEP
ncbi:Sodium-coupled monocarboxylate transporter 2, partial [Clonorchis sinensis]